MPVQAVLTDECTFHSDLEPEMRKRIKKEPRRHQTGVSRMSSRGLGHIFIGEHSKMSPVPCCIVSLFILLVTTAISRTRCIGRRCAPKVHPVPALGSRLGRRLLIFDKERESKSGASRKSRPIFYSKLPNFLTNSAQI